MSEQNKQLARDFYAAVNAGEIDRLTSFLSEDFVEHEPFPGFPSTREGVAQFFAMFRSAFPDFRMDEEDLIAEGDRIAVRGTMTGTHEGEFMGIAPTGKRFEASVIDIVRVENGKAAEHWGVTDIMAMMQQLGALPEQAPA